MICRVLQLCLQSVGWTVYLLHRHKNNYTATSLQSPLDKCVSNYRRCWVMTRFCKCLWPKWNRVKWSRHLEVHPFSSALCMEQKGKNYKIVLYFTLLPYRRFIILKFAMKKVVYLHDMIIVNMSHAMKRLAGMISSSPQRRLKRRWFFFIWKGYGDVLCLKRKCNQN